ncbi:unnamed protein product [Macrosiphum euphorbiae]|uniref:Integrase catalytic domain-containing protein n=1 Tax=Macrosiphum euphorbiae TaxID=13131 RepID=A0AAV0XZ86_9HEMI|nr:unnamed protein product [Macrosiphum euphorbiae]
MVRNCNECINARPNPPKSVLTPWKWPQRQWTRVHCDFLGPYKNKTFLIIVDAPTKWLEVFQSYCKTLGIRHLTGAPFHTASNGFAESGKYCTLNHK